MVQVVEIISNITANVMRVISEGVRMGGEFRTGFSGPKRLNGGFYGATMRRTRP